MGPYTIVEIRSPQVVVLEEPNSRNYLIINVKLIKQFNAATPTTHNSSSNNGHYKVKEVLKECTTDTGRLAFPQNSNPPHSGNSSQR